MDFFIKKNCFFKINFEFLFINFHKNYLDQICVFDQYEFLNFVNFIEYMV